LGTTKIALINLAYAQSLVLPSRNYDNLEKYQQQRKKNRALMQA
jgi:hypothetical protein